MKPRKSIAARATHAGPAGRDDEDFAPGKLDLYIDGLQGFFPRCTSQPGGETYSGSQVISGFARAATVTQISPPNAKNRVTADTTDQIIPTMMKSLMQGANFTATVDNGNTRRQDVLNTGSTS